MAQAAQNLDVLSSTDNIKILSNVLKTNVSACTSIGSFYLPQIGRIFLDMLGLYKAVSGIISETVAREGAAPRSYECWADTSDRANCHKNAESPTTTNCEEGDTEVDGNLHQESRRSSSGEFKLYATPT